MAARIQIDDLRRSAAVIALMVLLVISAATSAAAQEETDRAPVLLRKPLLLTPPETAGTGLAPEVKLRATVDIRGRVAAVEILEIAPASEYDALFRKATIETLRQWRYAPAIEDGEPAETTLEWSVQFLPKNCIFPGSHAAGGPPAFTSAEDEGTRRARIAALTEANHRELIEKYSAIAESSLDSEHRQRVDTARFVVVTDVVESEAARILANNLEATFETLHGIFRPDFELQPEKFKLVVYLYGRRASLVDASCGLGVSSPWAGGFYLAPGFFLFDIQHRTSEDFLHVVLHEAFHAYADRYLMHRSARLPLAIEEGFAEYLSNSKIKKGELIPGTMTTTRAFLVPFYGAVVRGRTATGFNVKSVQKAFREDTGFTVEDLVNADFATYYGRRSRLFYASSWLLVHFLRHGEPQWTNEHFPSLMLYLAEGYPANEALESVYKLSTDELGKRFRRYVGRL